MTTTTTTPLNYYSKNENSSIDYCRRFERERSNAIIQQQQQQSKSLSSFNRFMVLLLSLLLVAAHGFVIVQAFSPSSSCLFTKKKIIRSSSTTTIPSSSSLLIVHRPQLWKLYAAAAPADDDDEDEEEAMMDDSSLGDWRKFRASLIDEGLPTITTSQSSSTISASRSSSTPESKAATRRKSVAAQNEALLEQQSQSLAQEYKTGIWAHIIEQPEVGGLLCRMPLEAELYHGSSSSSTPSSARSSSASADNDAHGSYWKDKLRLMVSLENDKGNITATSALLTTKLDNDNDNNISKDNDDEEATVAKVKHWFAAAERMVNQELKAITEHVKIQNGILNPKDLNPNERILLDKYLGYKQTWQEISLVLLHNPQTGNSESVIINRPISTNLNKAFATVLVEGPNGRGKDSHSYEFVDEMVRAFGRQAAIYMGGPDLQEEPALLIHGLSNLRGAREVAPGTGIYQGGLEAAVEGINQGIYQPLDFRFFIGRQVYNPQQTPKGRGNLLQKVRQGQYQPVACARSLALKQCLGLPKPLWHEVLELCGGEMKALSRIELRKRIDLQQ